MVSRTLTPLKTRRSPLENLLDEIVKRTIACKNDSE
jgi:hypothetical protein